MIEETLEKFFRNTKLLVGLCIAIIMVIGGWGFWLQNKNASELKARALYSKAQQTLDSELVALAPPAPMAPVAKPKKKGEAPAPAPAEDTEEAKIARARYLPLNVDEKLKASITALRQVNEQYAGTQAGWDAALTLGQLYATHGDPKQSLDWFEKARVQANGNLNRAIAWYSLGTTHERLGQWPEALAAYQKALGDYEKAYPKPKTKKADSKRRLGEEDEAMPSAFTPEIRFGIVRAQAALKQFDAAKALLEEMKTDGPAAGPVNKVEQLGAWVASQEASAGSKE